MPSVRHGLHHAREYKDTKAQDIVEALVQVLDSLGWEEVYLHGKKYEFTLT
jgi:hypothetical protein